jgi:hypothetical protein
MEEQNKLPCFNGIFYRLLGKNLQGTNALAYFATTTAKNKKVLWHCHQVVMMRVILVTLVSVMQLALLLAHTCRKQLLAGLRWRRNLHLDRTLRH